MLVNWKVEYCDNAPDDTQPPDYYIDGADYWFFRYFREKPEVDVIDIRSLRWIESFEKNKLRFYVVQALRAIPKLNKYDLIVSHGMQSGVVVSLWRRFFRGKEKHIVFDIGSFASASESGFSLKLMQFSSKSIDGLIYHTSSQIEYYRKYFPWIAPKSIFIKYGADNIFFSIEKTKKREEFGEYILCVGYNKRDWSTLVSAYEMINTDVRLRFIGHIDDEYRDINNVEQLPFVPINELINQIYNAKFCVLPLEDFNYSYGQMTLLQQMVLGKCVIAARVKSLIDYAEDEENVLFYNPQDSADLASKMKRLLTDESIMEKIGHNAKISIDSEYNESSMSLFIEKAITGFVSNN